MPSARQEWPPAAGEPWCTETVRGVASVVTATGASKSIRCPRTAYTVAEVDSFNHPASLLVGIYPSVASLGSGRAVDQVATPTMSMRGGGHMTQAGQSGQPSLCFRDWFRTVTPPGRIRAFLRAPWVPAELRQRKALFLVRRWGE